RNPRQGPGAREHELAVAAIVAEAADLLLDAGEKVAHAARIAPEAVTAGPSHAAPLGGAPPLHHARHLVAGNSRQLETGKYTVLDELIAVTHAARAHAQ